jgi:hypothetical protein
MPELVKSRLGSVVGTSGALGTIADAAHRNGERTSEGDADAWWPGG